ncbi:MAG: Rpn family recombination-promoting nuclease/putative transposase, partial [Planctomycetia bacterium]|nr:Rpn family recombination-promoting nuclease/putative transposase [Planctomycetia bacterium]
MRGRYPLDIHPTCDPFVHYLFTSPGNEDLLLSFVNAVLEDSQRPLAKDVVVGNPFNIQRYLGDKWSVMDIKAVGEDGRIFEIEIQTLNHPAFINRSLYYWSREYSSQIREGEDYTQLNPVISIVMTRFELFPELSKLHNVFYITAQDAPEYILTEDFEFHSLELVEKKIIQIPKMPERLRGWIEFFSYVNQKTEEEMKVLIKKDKFLGKAYKKYEEFCQDAQMRQLAEDEWRNKLEKNTLLRFAREEGEAKGEARGEA